MSDDKKNESADAPESEVAADSPEPEQHDQQSSQDGPTFTKGPDPLSGVKKSAAHAMESMEGKTVSMKVYVGSIAGAIILMLLARCGG